MREYHKIQTVWNRDPETNHRTLIDGAWARPEFAVLADIGWEWTEKIDGTNIRIELASRTFAGKSDRAQVPVLLLERLVELFPEPMPEYGDMVLYGEGYGARIQKAGGNYIRDGVDFVLFDALCDGLWLRREDVDDIAFKLELRPVPVCGAGSLHDAIEMARGGFRSAWGDFLAEGLVMRPRVELQTRRGERIIAKVKHRDFAAVER